MNRYKRTFGILKKKKEKALVPFIVAGDPDYNTSLDIVKKIIESGADVLEIGSAFSDPIADGPTIQAADIRAIDKGMNTDKFFDFIKDVRKLDDKIPIGVLIYANIIYQRGIDRFYKDANAAGIDSVLVADLPIEEADPYVKASRKNKIDTVFIVSPLTDKKRLDKILKKAKGFAYVVSRLGVTGVRSDLKEETLNLIKRIRPHTKLPLCVGFGISKPEHVKSVLNAGADGVIVGSALVKGIEKNLGNKRKLLDDIENYTRLMKNATKDN